MARYDIDEIKSKVMCSAVLDSLGWQVDLRESTPKAIKYRRADGEVIVVIHDGRGWFDPRSEAKGDVFSLAQHLGADGFGAAIEAVAKLVGVLPLEPSWVRKPRRISSVTVSERWESRPRLTPSSRGWTYLTGSRGVPEKVVDLAASAGKLREGPQGSIWAAHEDLSGNLTGWEERGPEWRGFAAGGDKALFRLGAENSPRVCVTEAAIDALSLAAIEGCREDTVYVSTGGGWAEKSEQLIQALAARLGTHLVAAPDGDAQGDRYASRLREIAASEGATFLRLWPDALDWNEQLQRR